MSMHMHMHMHMHMCMHMWLQAARLDDVRRFDELSMSSPR